MPERTDEELVAAYVAGDGEAFRLLFERNAPTLLRFALRTMPSRADAEDLVQQTFLQVHRARRDFRAGSRFRPWLYAIATNLRHEHFRRIGRRPEAELTDALQAVLGAPAHGDLPLAVRQAMGRLPREQAEAIRLHWFEGLAFNEIAALVGASVSAVKVRAHRGYEALRRSLGSSLVTRPPIPP